jgi:hypothetical protein
MEMFGSDIELAGYGCKNHAAIGTSQPRQLSASGRERNGANEILIAELLAAAMVPRFAYASAVKNYFLRRGLELERCVRMGRATLGRLSLECLTWKKEASASQTTLSVE